MKDIFKKQSICPFLFGLLSAICGLLILLALGFKFVYKPYLDNHWEAISASASWAGVSGSLFSALIAIFITCSFNQWQKKYSEIQQRTSLFEMRFGVYEQAQIFYNARYILQRSEPFLLYALGRAQNAPGVDALLLVGSQSSKISMASFCYHEPIASCLKEMAKAYRELAVVHIIPLPNQSASKEEQAFISSCNKIDELGIFALMEKELQLYIEHP